MTSELEELADYAYRGEVRGQALFGAMADEQSDAARRRELEILRLLEAQTADVLLPLVERLGLDTTPTETDRGVGQRMAKATAPMPWADFLGMFSATTAGAIDKYRRLRELVDEADHPIVDDVIAHEEALQAFADASLAGGAEPLAPVIERLRDPWRSRVPAST